MVEAGPAPIVVRAVLSGNYSVGKTSLLRREVQNEFSQGIPTSIGIDFKLKMYQVGENEVKGQLWDSVYGGGGEKCYGGSQNKHHFYRSMNAISQIHRLLAFASPSTTSNLFYDLHQLIADIRGSTEARLFLIGCKGDLMPEVPDEVVMDYAQKHQLTYFRTSSLENWGVNEVFSEMMKQGLPLKLAQLQKQKDKLTDLAPLKPPCKQKCEIM